MRTAKKILKKLVLYEHFMLLLQLYIVLSIYMHYNYIENKNIKKETLS